MNERKRPHSEVLEDAIILNERQLSTCKHRIQQQDRKLRDGGPEMTPSQRRNLRRVKGKFGRLQYQGLELRERLQAQWLKHRQWEGHEGPERFDADGVLTAQQIANKESKSNESTQDRDGRRPALDDEQDLGEDQGASSTPTDRS